MRKLLTFCGMVAVFSSLALAETWSGRLVDATCYDSHQGQPQEAQKPAATCDVTSATSTFAIEVSGKTYKLDADGNAKVAAAMKNRADRSANPNSSTPAAVSAKVSGTLSADTIKVDSVTVM